MRLLGLALVLVGGSLLGGLAVANTYAPRQYYGGWNKFPGKPGYSYRHYYYKPTPTYYGYKHHYVVHNRATPRYNYYYNTYTKKYWGRCPTKNDGKPAYEILAEEYRKSDIKDVKEEHFEKYKDKKSGKDGMPPLPESKDGVEMDRPPDDTPPVETE